MSRPANVATGKCRDRQMSRPANVATGKCRDRQMSRPAEFQSANVAIGKCRDRQMSRPANVATGKCRDRQKSDRQKSDRRGVSRQMSHNQERQMKFHAAPVTRGGAREKKLRKRFRDYDILISVYKNLMSEAERHVKTFPK